jgi:hypothetical protein
MVMMQAMQAGLLHLESRLNEECHFGKNVLTHFWFTIPSV